MQRHTINRSHSSYIKCIYVQYSNNGTLLIFSVLVKKSFDSFCFLLTNMLMICTPFCILFSKRFTNCIRICRWLLSYFVCCTFWRIAGAVSSLIKVLVVVFFNQIIFRVKSLCLELCTFCKLACALIRNRLKLCQNVQYEFMNNISGNLSCFLLCFILDSKFWNT